MFHVCDVSFNVTWNLEMFLDFMVSALFSWHNF